MAFILRPGKLIPWRYLETDASGRLVVLGGYGRASAWKKADGTYYQLVSSVDNDGWFDDTSDGPVSAVVVLNGGEPDETRISAGTAVGGDGRPVLCAADPQRRVAVG